MAARGEDSRACLDHTVEPRAVRYRRRQDPNHLRPSWTARIPGPMAHLSASLTSGPRLQLPKLPSPLFYSRGGLAGFSDAFVARTLPALACGPSCSLREALPSKPCYGVAVDGLGEFAPTALILKPIFLHGFCDIQRGSFCLTGGHVGDKGAFWALALRVFHQVVLSIEVGVVGRWGPLMRLVLRPRSTPPAGKLTWLELPAVVNVLVRVEQCLGDVMEVGVVAGARRDKTSFHLVETCEVQQQSFEHRRRHRNTAANRVNEQLDAPVARQLIASDIHDHQHGDTPRGRDLLACELCQIVLPHAIDLGQRYGTPS